VTPGSATVNPSGVNSHDNRVVRGGTRFEVPARVCDALGRLHYVQSRVNSESNDRAAYRGSAGIDDLAFDRSPGPNMNHYIFSA